MVLAGAIGGPVFVHGGSGRGLVQQTALLCVSSGYSRIAELWFRRRRRLSITRLALHHFQTGLGPVQVSLYAIVQNLCSQLGLCQLWPQKRRLQTHTLHTLLPAQIPGCLRAAEDMRHIPPTTIGERVNTSSELPCYLFIGCPASGHEHYVEASEASNRNEEQACNTHYSQRDNGMQAVNVLPMVENEEQPKAKHGHDVGCQR